jgi:hypothetical protein
VQVPFETSGDEATGGDLPLDELVPAVVEDLNVFFEAKVDGFEGASAEDVLSEDETAQLLEDMSDRIGDNAAGLVLGLIWSEFAQKAAGADKGRDEEGQFLQQACLTGGWLASVFLEGGQTEERQLTLSPGDLDEAILGLIDLGGANENSRTAPCSSSWPRCARAWSTASTPAGWRADQHRPPGPRTDHPISGLTRIGRSA